MHMIFFRLIFGLVFHELLIMTPLFTITAAVSIRRTVITPGKSTTQIEIEFDEGRSLKMLANPSNPFHPDAHVLFPDGTSHALNPSTTGRAWYWLIDSDDSEVMGGSLSISGDRIVSGLIVMRDGRHVVSITNGNMDGNPRRLSASSSSSSWHPFTDCYPGQSPNRLIEISVSVVVDDRLSQSFETESDLSSAMAEYYFHAGNGLFGKQLNFNIVIDSIRIQKKKGKNECNKSPSHRLASLSRSRRSRITASRGNHESAFDFLFTGCERKESSRIIGLSIEGGLCKVQGGVGMSYYSGKKGSWVDAMHEMGHLFGATHGGDEGIMAGSRLDGEYQFSRRNEGEICRVISNVMAISSPHLDRLTAKECLSEIEFGSASGAATAGDAVAVSVSSQPILEIPFQAIAPGNVVSFGLVIFSDHVQLTMEGPDDRWFGLAFGQGMTSSPAVVFSGGGFSGSPVVNPAAIEDWFLQFPGVLSRDVNQDWMQNGNIVSNGRRTIIATRNLSRSDNLDFLFETTTGQIPISYGVGNGAGMTLAQHGFTSATRGSGGFVETTGFPRKGIPFQSISPGNVVSVGLEIWTDRVLVTMEGPDNVWFGVSFGSSMNQAPAIIFSEGGFGNAPVVTPASLGDYFLPGLAQVRFDAQQDWILTGNSVSGGRRTVTGRRNLVTGDGNDFGFDVGMTSVPISYAIGGGLNLAPHGGVDANRGNVVGLSIATVDIAMTSAPTSAPTPFLAKRVRVQEITPGNVVSFGLEIWSDHVALTMIGPPNRWFGVAFGQNMILSPAVIFSGGGFGQEPVITPPAIEDWFLNSPGSLDRDVNQDWIELTNSVANGRRTITARRDLTTTPVLAMDFAFDVTMTSVPISYAIGNGPGMTLAAHAFGPLNRGSGGLIPTTDAHCGDGVFNSSLELCDYSVRGGGCCSNTCDSWVIPCANDILMREADALTIDANGWVYLLTGRWYRIFLEGLTGGVSGSSQPVFTPHPNFTDPMLIQSGLDIFPRGDFDSIESVGCSQTQQCVAFFNFSFTLFTLQNDGTGVRRLNGVALSTRDVWSNANVDFLNCGRVEAAAYFSGTDDFFVTCGNRWLRLDSLFRVQRNIVAPGNIIRALYWNTEANPPGYQALVIPTVIGGRRRLSESKFRMDRVRILDENLTIEVVEEMGAPVFDSSVTARDWTQLKEKKVGTKKGCHGMRMCVECDEEKCVKCRASFVVSESGRCFHEDTMVEMHLTREWARHDAMFLKLKESNRKTSGDGMDLKSSDVVELKSARRAWSVSEFEMSVEYRPVSCAENGVILNVDGAYQVGVEKCVVSVRFGEEVFEFDSEATRLRVNEWNEVSVRVGRGQIRIGVGMKSVTGAFDVVGEDGQDEFGLDFDSWRMGPGLNGRVRMLRVKDYTIGRERRTRKGNRKSKSKTTAKATESSSSSSSTASSSSSSSFVSARIFRLLFLVLVAMCVVGVCACVVISCKKKRRRYENVPAEEDVL